ncbi:hypothetical protein [Glycomyces tenuis]|uniref:hypothetical protein n=1 Tax=Glycomyces tenuis TaxID=58116 RepID=UPI0003FD8D8B|nr:hypothetical protein [Glycomyces tenuis]
MSAYQPLDFNSLAEATGDIPQMIADLRDPFFDMYQREIAIAKWPAYADVIRLSKEEAWRRIGIGPGQGIPNSDNPLNHRQPSRQSSILPFFVPQEATAAEEQAIADSGAASATSAVDEIRSAFDEVLENGSLAAADTLLQKLSAAGESVDHLIETHDRGGFAKVEDLFDAWDGRDSEAGAEQFGERLRTAAGLHRMMTAQLIQGGSAECAAKLTTQMYLGSTLKSVHEQIDELMTGTSTLVKVLVRTAFNEIPHSGGIVSLLDGLLEQQGSGETAAGNWLTAAFGKLDMEYDMGLEPQKGSVLRQQLLAAAAYCKDTLKNARDEAQRGLGIDLSTWQGFFPQAANVLIPGEPV